MKLLKSNCAAVGVLFWKLCAFRNEKQPRIHLGCTRGNIAGFDLKLRYVSTWSLKPINFYTLSYNGYRQTTNLSVFNSI